MACQQALRVLVRRDFNQRAIEFDAGIAKFDLMLTVLEGEQGLRCCAEYNTALFGKDDIRQMLADYQRFLETAVSQPDIKISQFN